MYDPALGRWHVQDPLAEYHFNMSPYHYVENNPLRYIDPFGLDKEDRQRRRHMRKYGGDKYIPEVAVTAKGPGKLKTFFKKIGRALRNPGNDMEGEGGHQNAGDHYVTSGRTGSPTKQTADDPGNTINTDDLFPAMKGIGKSPTPTIGPLTPAKEINRAGKIIREVQQATSDKKIRNDNTGNSEAASPENQTIVKTYSGYDQDESDSVVVSYGIKFREGGPTTYRDKKQHKHTNMGRWISKPYEKK